MNEILKDRTLFKQSCLVDGCWVSGKQTTPVINPADGKVLGTIPLLSYSQVEQAIDSADIAMREWRSITAKQRSKLLMKWFYLIESHVDDLATIMTLEQGKPLAEAKGEILYAASFIEWFAEEAKRVYGDVIAPTLASNRIMTIKQPIGVCGAITPWNFPAAMITRKAAPALAAGCSIVIKPSIDTPYTAMALAELSVRAGIPAGVFNVVTGEAVTLGNILTQHPKIAKFSFTGSTQVGRILLSQCASTIKKSSMELGGNAPFIVFGDANLDDAVAGAVAAKFRNGGQTCVCVNRIYVHESVYDRFCHKFVEAVGTLKVGNGLDPEVKIGPMITQEAIDQIQTLVDDALLKGAQLESIDMASPPEGQFLLPRVLTQVMDSMDIVHTEIFGPVATILKFSSEEEVIQRANETIYGLASYFYTNDINRVYRVSERLEYGMVGVNTGIISNEVAPFGGVKQSGLGREGSKYGIEDYLEVKYVCVNTK
ncbi:NAD-dependent succinate-semialdehyde dehydrogenase [Vibrio sp. SCSIO 43136]|uniref:NAD-dependent succinate-semialdehyde dehydrogenase n=1 Tax=Vibrio sp. SCSIO 43136 TaxID=2819101 RepID=UPI0020763FF7|nr:NAD-dependent succinate-semialdehyde dehydrogenase [Vibrio sp. SCSIO 43136]USD67083.1 NAD-dependent succinate-semialdehyde dehydrogenase [Vibrio sp. SCSIO 43136]